MLKYEGNTAEWYVSTHFILLSEHRVKTQLLRKPHLKIRALKKQTLDKLLI